MYCNYYKLYKNIYDFLKNNYSKNKIIEELNNNNIVKYQDLNIEIEYDIKCINLLYQNILKGLSFLSYQIKSTESDIEKLLSKTLAGLNIDNFLNCVKFDKENLQNNLNLFIETLKNFNKLHLKYLLTFFKSVKLFYEQINNDINIELINNYSTLTIDSSNNNLKDLLNQFIPLKDINNKNNFIKNKCQYLSEKKKNLVNFYRKIERTK